MVRKSLFILAATFILALGCISEAEAVVKYWIGGTAGNFNDNTRWSTISGGANNTTAPGSADLATFNGSGLGSCTITADPNVGGINIVAGYTGTITQNTGIALTIGTQHYAQAGGTFTGGNSAISVAGNWSLSGGTFTSTTGTMSITGNYSRSGGTFTHNSGTVTFNGTSGTILITPGGQAFNNITFNDTAGTATYQLQGALTVSNDLTVTDGILDTKAGSNFAINVTRDFTQSGGRVLAQSSTVTVGRNFSANGTELSTGFNSASLVLTGTGGLSYTNRANFSDGFYNLTVGQSGNTTTLTSDLGVSNVLTVGTGTFAGTATNSLYLTGSGITPLVFNAASTVSLYALKFFGATQNIPTLTNGYDCHIDLVGTNSTLTQSGPVTINSSRSLMIAGDSFIGRVNTYNTAGFALRVGGNIQIGQGGDTGAKTLNGTNSTITVGGNIDIRSGTTTFTSTGSTVVMNGSALQTVLMSGENFNNLTITNASAGGVQFLDGFTAANITDTTAGSKLTFKNGATYTISGTLTLEGNTGSKITLLSDSPGTRFTLTPSGAAQTVNYVDVKDSQASTNNITANYSTNSGNNDNAEAVPHWIFPAYTACSYFETSVYKVCIAPGEIRELYLKQSSSPTTNVQNGGILFSFGYGNTSGLIGLWNDASVTTTVVQNNSAVYQLRYSGAMKNGGGTSYGSSTSNVTFYRDRFVIDASSSTSQSLGTSDQLFCESTHWDEPNAGTTYRYCNGTPCGAVSTITPPLASSNYATPFTFQVHNELGATDGLATVVTRDLTSNWPTATRQDGYGASTNMMIDTYKAAPVTSTTYRMGALINFDTGTAFDNSLAQQHNNDYITPATLNFTGGDGSVVGSGFDATRDIYTLDDNSANDHVKFTFTVGSYTPRFTPVFEITNWNTTAPSTILVGGVTKSINTDYLAAVTGTTLTLQYLSNLSADTIIEFPPWLTTIGNGTDPGNTTIAPSATATMADAFTLQTNTGTDTITAVTVTLATGTSGGISLVEITNDAGSTVYGSVSNPGSDTPSISLSTNITATTSSTQYKIRVTPKTHANMPAPVGSTYNVTAYISNWTGTNTHAGSDTGGATVIIDNQSPGDVSGSNATPGSGQVSLTWSNPVDTDLGSIIVLRRTGGAVADTPVEGTTYSVGNTIGSSTVACVVAVPGTSCIDSGLSNGTAYYYKIFTKDSSGNYSTGATPTGSPATPSASVTAQVYYSVGQNTTDHKTGSPTVTISSGTATFSVPQTASNMGVGDKVTYNGSTVAYISGKISYSVWTLVTATGGTPADVSNVTVNSIAHPFASLNAAITGATGASYLNTGDLVTGKFILNFPCYYDSGPDTTFPTVTGYTTGANNYIKIYTPFNTSTEVNQSQRHNGTYDTTKYRLETAAANYFMTISEANVYIEGLQSKRTAAVTANGQGGFLIYGAGSSSDIRISSNILQGYPTAGDYTYVGIEVFDATSLSSGTLYAWNNIIYDFQTSSSSVLDNGILNYDSNGDFTIYAYNNTIYNCGGGLRRDWGSFIAKNNIVAGSGDTNTYIGTFAAGTDYNATDSADSIGVGSNNRTGQTFTFVNTGSKDFHLGTCDSGAKNYGTSLSGDSNRPFSTDIDAQSRPMGSAWDIGADEGAGSCSITTTLGNGTDPGNASIGPGGAATMADAFTLQTSSGTDMITAVTVTLATSTYGGLSLVEITNDDGTFVYGSVPNPGSDTPAITLSNHITATTTLTQYKIRVTPKSHADMPAPAGSTYSVTARISAWTGSNTQAGSDTAGTTVTIDNTSPGNVTGAAASDGNGQVSLSWTNPGDSDLGSIIVLRRTGGAVADTPVEGTTYTVGNTIGSSTVACVVASPSASCIDRELTNGTAYYYKIFTQDTNGNYSATGTTPSGSPATPVAPANTHIYYSVGQNTSDHKTGSPTVTISSGTATFSEAQTAANMGVGDQVTYNGKSVYITAKTSTTVWTVITATGGIPADVTNATVTSIAHAFNSLFAAEAGASDASHLNTVNLVTGNYILNIPCYFDNGADITATTVDGWTTGASNYIRIYTPTNASTECNQSQRHDGKWNTGKYILSVTAASTNCILINDEYTRVEGLQISTNVSGAIWMRGITANTLSSPSNIRISNNIVRQQGTTTDINSAGILLNDIDATFYVWNNIVYDFSVSNHYGIWAANAANAYIYNNTIHNCNQGLGKTNGTAVAKNNLLKSCPTAATGTFAAGTDYNATNNASMGYTVTGGGNTHDRVSQTFTFVNEGADDFHLAGTDHGAKDRGADLSGDANLAFSTDIDADTRPVSTVWDIGADESTVVSYSVSGKVYEDANFAGTAADWDGGTNDKALPSVDVELYDNSNVYQYSETTDASGNYSFTGLANGTWKVRVRAATIGDADTTPLGGLNATVPATWPYPLPEMTWGNGSALYGGVSATVDDTATGDNAGIGDNYVTLTISGANASNVNLGFAYNLIVDKSDDGVVDATRSKQGTLRQFLKNANAIGTAGSTTANTSQFRIPAGQLVGGVATVTVITRAMPLLSDSSGGTTLDGTTQTTSTGDTNPGLAPEIEVRGGVANIHGFNITSSSNTIKNLVINNFTGNFNAGIYVIGASANGNTFTGNYVGTNYAGTAAAANDYGIFILNGASNNIVGGSTAAERNLLSGNVNVGAYIYNANSNGNLIKGNYIGTNAAGTAGITNIHGVLISNGPQSNIIGGVTAGEGNLIAYNTRGVVLDYTAVSNNNKIQMNLIRNNTSHGINIVYGNNTKIYQNTIHSNGGDGIRISATIAVTGTVIKNNIITGNTAYGINRLAAAMTESYNLITNNSTTPANGSGQCNVALNSTDMNANPLYTNAAAGDFTLQNASPAINRGLDLAADQPDMNGASAGNFNGYAPEMGYWESSVTTTCPVSSTADSGAGTLRGCITYANSNPGTTVSFSISSGDSGYQTSGSDHWWRISPSSVLPTISANGTVIDGTTQTTTIGEANTLGPEIELYGGGQSFDGFTITSANNVIRGFLLTRFDASGTYRAIKITGAGATSNTIAGNYIGTNFSGTTASAATYNSYGIGIENGAPSNTIGGTTAADRNIISGNSWYGILIDGAGTNSNQVKGNYIGTNASGTAAVANNSGIIISGGAQSNIIGGSSAARNIISGNTNGGITVTGSGTNGTIIKSNYIGLDVNGTTAIANSSTGISVNTSAQSTQIGGTGANEGNIISSNTSMGIWISSLGTDSATIQGNYIGTDVTGLLNRGNGAEGIYISAGPNSNVIGGTGAGAANIIAFNSGDGVGILFPMGAGLYNRVSGNSIHSNSGLGIDLAPDGVGATGGANNNKARPTITGITSSGANFTTTATVTAGDTIEFFRVNNTASPGVTPDPTGSGEGFLYLGQCVDNGACSGPHISAVADANAAAGTVQATLLSTGLIVGDYVTSTATDAVNNTSEFSVNMQIAAIYQPDAMIKLSAEGDGSYLTGNTYEATATVQIKSKGGLSGSTAAYTIKFENDANVTDSLLITGTATGSNFTVQYLDDTSTDRTAAVTGAGYTISSLAVGASKVWTLNVTPSGDPTPVAGGASYNVFVTATSTNDSAKKDQIKATTTSTSANLTLLKNADKANAAPGDEISYTVTASNGSGLTAASNIVLTDPVPTYTGFKLGAATFNAGTSTLTAAISYSNDSGSTWTYTPVSEACSAPAGYDYCVTHVKWTMSGTMPTDTNFSIGLVVRVK